jgi:hypothetical protein
MPLLWQGQLAQNIIPGQFVEAITFPCQTWVTTSLLTPYSTLVSGNGQGALALLAYEGGHILIMSG